MAASMPLECTICNKSQPFSDLSHLLTHINSKGHLACYHKHKIQAATNPQLAASLREYDDWYNHYDFERRIAERMNSKDRKNSKKNSRPHAGATSRATSARCGRRPASRPTRSVRLPRHASTSSRASSALSIDSRGQQATVKQEQKDCFSANAYHHAGQQFQQAPGVPGYPSVPWSSLRAAQSGYRVICNNMYSPALPGQLCDGASQYYSDADSLPGNMPGSDEMDRDLSLDEDSSETKDESEPRLKGVVFDGMGIFDSASALDRRRRNQKKDESVLQKLESNSLRIQPMEEVMSPGLTVCKRKEITGLPTSSSPVKSPLQAWRPSLDINPRQLITTTKPRQTRASAKRRQRAMDDYDDEFQLSAKVHTRKRKTLQIYEDNADHGESSRATTPAASAFAFNPRGLPQYNDHGDDIHHARRRRSHTGRLDNQPYENALTPPFFSISPAHSLKPEDPDFALASVHTHSRGAMKASSRLNESIGIHSHSPTIYSTGPGPSLADHNLTNSAWQNAFRAVDVYNTTQSLNPMVHGSLNRRSIGGGIPMNDILNNYGPSSQPIYPPSQFGYGYPAIQMPYGPQAHGMSQPPASASDSWHNAWSPHFQQMPPSLNAMFWPSQAQLEPVDRSSVERHASINGFAANNRDTPHKDEAMTSIHRDRFEMHGGNNNRSYVASQGDKSALIDDHTHYHAHEGHEDDARTITAPVTPMDQPV